MTEIAVDPVRFTQAGVLRGARRLAPVALVVTPFGFAYGAAAIDAGLSLDQAVLLSAFVFAGASQFAALDLWASPPPYLSLVLVVLAINARHLIYGAALSPWIGPRPSGAAYAALAVLTDANFADSRAAYLRGERDFGVVLGGGLALWSVWVVSTLVGGLAGGAIDDIGRYGLDVVMAAFFAMMTVGLLDKRAAALPAIVGGGAILAVDGVVGTGWDVVVAALCGGVAAAAAWRER